MPSQWGMNGRIKSGEKVVDFGPNLCFLTACQDDSQQVILNDGHLRIVLTPRDVFLEVWAKVR